MLPTNTTDDGFPHADVNRMCLALERMHPNLLDLRVNHGFPWADITHPTATVVATVAHDPTAAHAQHDVAVTIAAAAARQVATYLWTIRSKMLPNYPGPEVAVAKAARLAATQSGSVAGPVVINEASDNTGAGAVGDATHLLGAMLAAGLGEQFPGRVAFAVILDTAFVEAASRAGVGSAVDLMLGAQSGPQHGTPIRVRDGVVQAVSDGKCVLEHFAPGLDVSYGKTVRVL